MAKAVHGNERATAAWDAVSQIKDKFGDGAIMRLGEAKRMEVEAISTQCLSLDLALGVGGLPRGRVVEVYGPEASGKCVSRDTMVFTDQGMLPIDAFGRLAVPGFQRREILVHAERCYEKTSHFYNGGLRKTVHLRTHRGFELEGTPNHRVRVLDRDGHYLFRRLDELQPDDRIAIQRNQQCFGTGANLQPFTFDPRDHDHSSKPFRPPATLSKDWALLMGYLVGDGTCTETGLNRNNITLTVGDPETERDVQQLCERLFRERARVTKDRRTKTVKRLTIHSARARSFLAYAGLGWWGAAAKEIPWSVLCGPKRVVAAFLSALFTCDGCFSSATIEYCTKSERLAKQMQTVLLNFGIIATRKVRHHERYGDYHYLAIEGREDKQRFAAQIGFCIPRKQRALQENLGARRHATTNLDVLPLQGILQRFLERYRQSRTRGTFTRAEWDLFYDYLPEPRGGGHALTYDRLHRILRRFAAGRNIPEYQAMEDLAELGFYWDRIGGVQPSRAHVVDFTVPKGATFFGNGFVNHNTTLALHVAAEAQKQGGIVAFVDAEHALDPEYAAKLGVKTDELLISQPDTGEQALDIVETLVRSAGIDVIVVDSVAALVPKAEIEGEMGDQHMGLQARLMSQALRKLTPIVSSTRTCLIFINQIRMKIGIVFGNPETTTGGNALKFYSSMRIEVRRSAQIKQNERVIGNIVKVKIAKNKVAPPFRQCTFEIMYNEGISVTGDLLDLGVQEQVIEKRGNSYAWGEVKLGMGREAAKQTLRDQPTLMTDLRAAILDTAEKREAIEHPAIRTSVSSPEAKEEEPALAEAT